MRQMCDRRRRRGRFCSRIVGFMAQTKPTIPIIVKDTTSVYWRTVLAGARKAGQDLGVAVTGGNRHPIQIRCHGPGRSSPKGCGIEARGDRHCAGAVFSARQADRLKRPNTVKIIGIGSGADTKALTSLVATDDLQVGHVAADALALAITRTYADTEGDVAVISASAAAPDQSATGFRQQVAEKYRALNVLPDKVADAQAAIGLGIIKELVDADRDLRGVFLSNVVMADGATQVVYNKSSGDRINYVIYGSDDKLLKALQDGTIAALVVQDPFRIGYEGIKTALAASKGEKVPATCRRYRRQSHHKGEHQFGTV